MTTPEKKSSEISPRLLKNIMDSVRKTANYDKEIYFIKKKEIHQQEYPVIDSKGIRWCMCSYCGKIDVISEFISYGGKGNINKGVCYGCREIVAKESAEKLSIIGKSGITPGNACPYCGGKVVRRNGKYGAFWECSKYPSCRFRTK